MDIQNDTNQPVDYDIQLDGGGQGMTAESGNDCFCGTPKFRIKGGGKMSFSLAPGSTSVNHVFLINPDTSTPTLVELRGAPTNQNAKLMEAEDEGIAFYTVVTSA